jgi:hypothetical protein
LFETTLDAACDGAVIFDQKESHGFRSSTMGLGVWASGSPERLLHRQRAAWSCRTGTKRPRSSYRAALMRPTSDHEVMSEITIHELEAAINFWRARSPSSGDELVLCKEASALSKPYALMIVQRQQTLSPERLDGIAKQAWDSYVRLNNNL